MTTNTSAVFLAVGLTLGTCLWGVRASGQEAEPTKPDSPLIDPTQHSELGFGGPFTGDAADNRDVAMGIPASAIPGRKWIAGSQVIVAFSDDGKRIFAYSEQHPRWAPQDLTQIAGRSVVPVLGDMEAAVWHGNACYAYSAVLGTWDVLVLPPDESAIPSLGKDSVSVHSPTRGDFVYKNAWGKWFSAEEIKAGRVAEFLRSRRDEASGDPGESVGTKGTTGKDGTVEHAATDKLCVYHLQFAEAQAAGRILEQVLASHGKKISLATDTRTNSLLIRAPEEYLREAEMLLKTLDVPHAGPDSTTMREPTPIAAAGESVAELRATLRQHEQQSRQLANRLRGPWTLGESARKEAERQLRDAVRQAFGTRQKLQRAELAAFTRRLRSIQETIDMRDRLGPRIIERRIEELLDPNVNWQPDNSVPAPTTPTLQGTTTESTASEYRDPGLSELRSRPGIHVEPVPDETLFWQLFGAKFRGHTEPTPGTRYVGGLRIIELRKEGPAEKSGLRIDDTVVAIDGVGLRTLVDLNRIWQTSAPRKSSDVVYVREGKLGQSRLEWATIETGPRPTFGVVLSRSDNALVELVEISLGFDDGIRVGDLLPIIANRDVRGVRVTAPGLVEVIRVEADRSIARIRQESEETPIQMGAVVSRKPQESADDRDSLPPSDDALPTDPSATP